MSLKTLWNLFAPHYAGTAEGATKSEIENMARDHLGIKNCQADLVRPPVNPPTGKFKRSQGKVSK